MALTQDFVVRSGIQINTNLVVGSYWLANAAPVNGAIISGNVGIGTATPAKELTLQNDLGATTYYADLGIPTINPSFVVNFISSTPNLDSRVSFTRASNASVVTSTGNIAIISNNVPAIEYDPSTLNPLGLRIESSRTNLIGNNISLGTGWSTIGSAIYQNNTYSIDGGLNASNLVVSSTGTDTGYTNYSISITPSGSTIYTLSIFAKKGTSDIIEIYGFYLGTGTRASFIRYTFSTNAITAGSGEGPGVVPIAYGAIPHQNGWVRLWFTTYDALGTNTTLLIRPYSGRRGSPGVTTGDYTYFWGAQGEIGIYPTSLIYNPGSGTATRSADLAVVTPISSWFNPVQGMIRVTASVPYTTDSNYQTAAEIYNSSNGNSQLIVARYNVGGVPQVRAIATDGNGYTVSNQITNTWSNSRVSTATLSYNTLTGVYASAFNAAPVGSTVNTVPIWNTVSPNQLNLGNRANGTYFLDGYIRNLSYYPVSQSNAVVQSFSLP